MDVLTVFDGATSIINMRGSFKVLTTTPLTSSFDFNIFLGSLARGTRFGLPRPGCGFDGWR